ncbi:tyrosine-protein phosphatase SIW14 [Phyllosticta citrichinensis]|uniref:Tyrosine-protein phosphatase SIW14 n=1 Tax=Phyllosticta citrichinensis TaxID=1130410 RepID=A0ABR1Y5L8_9PEZI
MSSPPQEPTKQGARVDSFLADDMAQGLQHPWRSRPRGVMRPSDSGEKENIKDPGADTTNAVTVTQVACDEDSSTSAVSTTAESSRRSSYEARCPERLMSMCPPSNYGTVLDGQLYRSSYPQPENFGFLKSLKLKSILTLVKEDIPEPFERFMADNKIEHFRVHLPANKGKVCMTQDLMVQALGVVLNKAHYPLLIHCNKGKHRTGCVVACLDKVLAKPLKEAKDTYHTYADPKAREMDEKFIDGFDERSILWLARAQGFVPDDEPRSAASSPLKTQSQIA